MTIVAACISAETGVGPSIASGNQVCNIICADLPIAPMNKSMQIKSIELKSKLKKFIFSSRMVGINLNTSS